LRRAARGVAAALTWPAAAAADGPYEPNETAAMVTAPATAARIDAALETPQDEDWYLLHPQGVRQLGVLATLATPYRTSYGRISIELLDGEGSSYPIASLGLGYEVSTSARRTADTLAFTSELGHRYFLHVTQSGCDGSAYSLQLTP